MKYPVFIPTLGRVEHQSTLKLIPDAVLVVEPREASLHPNRRILVLPEDGRGIAYARSWIHHQVTTPKYWVLDDDVKGFCAFNDDGYLRKCSWDRFAPLAESFDEEQNVGLIGFPYRFHMFGDPYINGSEYKINSLLFNVFLVTKDIPVCWDCETMLREDVEMQLRLMLAGWKTVKLWGLGVSPGPKGVAGGCEDLRSAQSEEDWHQRIMKRFPEFYTKSGRFNHKYARSLAK